MGRWIRWGLLTLLLVAVVAGLAGAVLRGGTKELLRRPGAALRLEVREEGLFWLEAPAAPRRQSNEAPAGGARRLLSLARGAASPTVLAEAPGIADFSLADAVYYVTQDALARVPLAGGAPTVLRSGLSHPAAVLAAGDWVFWTETRPAAAFSLPVLPLTRPATLLRAMPKAGGAPLTLSSADTEDGARLQLLGVADDALYWAEHRSTLHPATLFKRFDLPHSPTAGLNDPLTLASEEGIHDGVPTPAGFYWTGGSREGAPAGAYVSVNVRGKTREASEDRLLGDWLRPGGRLRVDGGQAYYCHQGVFALPGDAGAPHKLIGINGAGTLVAILHDNAYFVQEGTGQEYRILRHALHSSGGWAARRGAVP